ncbi:DUF349 domain-containing protein [Fulvivirgaceae bacterium BMA10]|uniref:DUF349 domain-containing protein n=1 Tax=Splendidivirga corallicola TaxID=3051826 RepID=A0ABT8KWX8_9BACT|nr:DUF349 domain-containing protein [Fulvivirgaceae bacterium BMA10]
MSKENKTSEGFATNDEKNEQTPGEDNIENKELTSDKDLEAGSTSTDPDEVTNAPTSDENIEMKKEEIESDEEQKEPEETGSEEVTEVIEPAQETTEDQPAAESSPSEKDEDPSDDEVKSETASDQTESEEKESEEATEVIEPVEEAKEDQPVAETNPSEEDEDPSDDEVKSETASDQTESEEKESEEVTEVIEPAQQTTEHQPAAEINPSEEDENVPDDEIKSETSAEPIQEDTNDTQVESGEEKEKKEEEKTPVASEENAVTNEAEAEQAPESAKHEENEIADEEVKDEAQEKEKEAEEPTEVEASTEEGASEVVSKTQEQEEQKTEAKEQQSSEENPKSETGGEHEVVTDELLNADYSESTKEELVKVIQKLAKSNDVKRVDTVLKLIDPVFNKIKNEERDQALKAFVAGGGEESDFSYKDDQVEIYDATHRLLKDKKNKYYSDLELQKQRNYEKANEVLENLRKLVDGEETTTSINSIKEIQAEWKAIGQVPGQHAKNLWANYNALMDRFYDNRSIYFELKELDRRKNLKAKLELCERAEKLDEIENIKDAIKVLNELHDEFKHQGPVPKEEQEGVWQRFKAASDKIYAKRKVFHDQLKKELEENFVAKGKLAEEVQAFATYDSNRIVEWNQKTKEILELQKRWEAIGGLPREKAKEVNKPFWTGFKAFFNNKNHFFKKLEGQREENLKLKEELVEKAIALQESTDWEKTANDLKHLQADWKNIGPVPEKFRNEIYKRFKDACDHFFNNRRANLKEVEKEYFVNLEKKEEICNKIMKLAEEGSSDVDALAALQEEWNHIGFVPRNAIKKIQSKFTEAVDAFIEKAQELDEEDRNKLKLTIQLHSLKGTPNSDRKLNKKEFNIRKQITNIENDISLWKNNLEFFANSKNADQVREEFESKIDKATKELENLKEQLRIIRRI